MSGKEGEALVLRNVQRRGMVSRAEAAEVVLEGGPALTLAVVGFRLRVRRREALGLLLARAWC